MAASASKAKTINICYIFRQDNARARPRIGRAEGRRGGMGGGGGAGREGKEDGGGGKRGQGVAQTALILGKA